MPPILCPLPPFYGPPPHLNHTPPTLLPPDRGGDEREAPRQPRPDPQRLPGAAGGERAAGCTSPPHLNPKTWVSPQNPLAGGLCHPPPPHAHSGVWECLKPPYTHPKTCPWWRMEWFLYGFNKVAAQWFLGCRHVPFRGEFGGTPPPSPPPPCDFGGRGGPPPSAPRGHKALQVAVSVGEVGREGGLEGNPMFIRDGLGGGG